MKPTLQLLQLLSQDHGLLDEVHERSLDLLSATGIRFHSERAREILHGAGADVDGEVVKLPGHLVESALRQAPSTFTLHARDGSHDLPIDGQ